MGFRSTMRKGKISLISKKEEKIQRALGLIHTYEGYVKPEGTEHFSVYAVNAFSYSHANSLLNKICKSLKKRTRRRHFVKFIIKIEK